jgi:hypothetical protein
MVIGDLLSLAMDLQGLNFCLGIGVQEVIRSKFGCPVSLASPDHAFFLVASFGHCKFKLSPSSVGFLLQATIGGVAKDFDVLPLLDRVVSVFDFFEWRWFSCR